MNALASRLYHGTIQETEEEAFSTPQKPGEAADLAYFLFRRTTKLPPLKTRQSRTAPDSKTQKMGFYNMSAMSMVSVQTAIRSHFRNADVSSFLPAAEEREEVYHR